MRSSLSQDGRYSISFKYLVDAEKPAANMSPLRAFLIKKFPELRYTEMQQSDYICSEWVVYSVSVL